MTDLNFVNSDCSLLDIQIVFSLFFIESPFTVYNDVQCLELDKCWPTSVTVGGCFDYMSFGYMGVLLHALGFKQKELFPEISKITNT